MLNHFTELPRRLKETSLNKPTFGPECQKCLDPLRELLVTLAGMEREISRLKVEILRVTVSHTPDLET